MDLKAEPFFSGGLQFGTNARFFTFLEITDSLKDIETFINHAESEAIDLDPMYRFEFFCETYLQSHMRFDFDSISYFKYKTRYILYEVQVKKNESRASFLYFPTRGQYTTVKLIACSAFYYMIFFTYDNAIKFLENLKCDAALTVLSYFKSGSFSKIVNVIESLWYMPWIRPNPSIEMQNLEKINNMERQNDNEFDREVQLIVGYKKPQIENVPLIITESSSESEEFKENFNDFQLTYSKKMKTSGDKQKEKKLQKKDSSQTFLSPVKNNESKNESFDSFKTPLKTLMIGGRRKIGSKMENSPILNNFPTKRSTKKETCIKDSPLNESCSHLFLTKKDGKSAAYQPNRIKNIDVSTRETSANDSFVSSSFQPCFADQHNEAFIGSPYMCSPKILKRIKRTSKSSFNCNETIIEENILNQSIDMTFNENFEYPKFKKYECTEVIGSGSYSKVFEAVIKGDKNKYAMKVLRFDECQPKEIVLNEIAIMDVMAETGRSILLIDSRICDNGAIIVMEKGLTDMKTFYANKSKMIDKYFILHYWRLMLQCVEALHDKNIAHLDLKLQNFVITENLSVKLIDYGISKMLDPDSSIIVSDSVGTIVFMSPELLLNEREIRPFKCDIWSMGIVLYTMIFDRQPVLASTFEEYVKNLIDCDCKLQMPDSENNNPLLEQLMHFTIIRNPQERKHASELLNLMDSWD